MLSRVHTVNVDGGPGAGPGSGESILDIQDVSAFAPGANIDVYQAPNTTFGSLDEYAKIVNDDVDQVVTTSWGFCEQGIQEGSPGVQQAENVIFEQAAAQGQSVFSAAGDEGSDDCNSFETTSPVSPVLSVDDPSSQPYVVAAGGTTIDDATQPALEQVWNDGPVGGAGGGGISESWPMPAWQDSPVVQTASNSSAVTAANAFEANDLGEPGYQFCASDNPVGGSEDGCRELPDVSADADEFTGAITIFSRPVRRLDHDRRHLVGRSDVGGHAGGRQRVVDVPGEQRDEDRRRLRQPAPVLGRGEPDGVQGVVQRHHAGKQRRVRRLEPLPVRRPGTTWPRASALRSSRSRTARLGSPSTSAARLRRSRGRP